MIVHLKENRILWVKKKREENSANPRVLKSVLKAVCNKNVIAWCSGVNTFLALADNIMICVGDTKG